MAKSIRAQRQLRVLNAMNRLSQLDQADERAAIDPQRGVGESAEPQSSFDFLVDIDGYEGPLDLLLSMARTQKVDMREISVLALAECYLKFITEARALKLELAADYLVMASWLTYLKSRLLLPPEEDEQEPDANMLAAHLAFQLERLAAMRDAGARLFARDQLGRDFFARGSSETLEAKRVTTYTATLYDLLGAYSRISLRENFTPLHYERSKVMSMEDAYEKLRPLLGGWQEWRELESFIPPEWREEPAAFKSALASNFAATLQLVKEGKLWVRQRQEFGAILLTCHEPLPH